MNLRNALAAAAFCVLPALVQAQGMSQWGRAGGWAIKIDDQLNNGCLFEKRFSSGVLVRFGIDRSRNESAGPRAWPHQYRPYSTDCWR